MEARKSKLRTHIEALNEQYAAWIKKELEDHKLELWIDGATQYISHAQKLQEEFKSMEAALPFKDAKPSTSSKDPITSKSLLNGSLRGEEKEAGNPAASTSKPFAGFDWGKAQESESTKATADKPQPFQGFGAKKPSEPFAFGSNAGAQGQESLFGQTPQKSGTEAASDQSASPKGFTGFKFPASDAPFAFGSSGAKTGAEARNGEAAEKPSEAAEKPSTTGFKFPAADSTAPAFGSTPGPFGAPFSANKAPFGGFSFGGANKPADGEKQGKEEEEDQEDNEAAEEENNEPLARQDEASTQVVFETKGTLHVQSDDKTWAGRGKGTLTIRKPKEGPGRPYIVFASDVGQIFLNASIQKGLKPLEKDKNRIMMTLVWAEKEEDEAKGRCVLVKFLSQESSKNFQEEIATLAKQ